MGYIPRNLYGEIMCLRIYWDAKTEPRLQNCTFWTCPRRKVSTDWTEWKTWTVENEKAVLDSLANLGDRLKHNPRVPRCSLLPSCLTMANWKQFDPHRQASLMSDLEIDR